jgi:hypothetical protein
MTMADALGIHDRLGIVLEHFSPGEAPQASRISRSTNEVSAHV